MYLIKKESTAGKNVAGVQGKHSKGLNKAHKVQRCQAITENLENEYIGRALFVINRRNDRQAYRNAKRAAKL
jgi:hypothetical protein